eukprot:9192067-Alexandrium_andersonii.AAC.1
MARTSPLGLGQPRRAAAGPSKGSAASHPSAAGSGRSQTVNRRSSPPAMVSPRSSRKPMPLTASQSG